MKFDVKDFFIMFGTITLFLIFVGGILYGTSYFLDKPYENACIDYGFEGYDSGGSGSFQYCIDKKGNFHTVSFENDGFNKYKVKEIKVYSYGEFVKQNKEVKKE